jgi:uncharacterized paraquat-inducible protein A
MKRTAKLSAFSLFLLMLAAGVAAACPTCGDGIGQSDPQGQSLAAGMYYSILFMMSMPYLILATLGCVAYLSIRRARLANANGGPEVEAPPSPQN